MKLILVVCLLVHGCVAATPPTFDGYIRLEDKSLPQQADAPYFLMNPNVTGTDKDSLAALCDADSRCFAFADTINQLIAMPTNNDTVTTYVSNTRCGSTHAGFGFVNGSCGRTDVQYMTCEGTRFVTEMLHQFDYVTPDICKGICDEDSDCTVFAYATSTEVQGHSHCETYKWHDTSVDAVTGFLKISALAQQHAGAARGAPGGVVVAEQKRKSAMEFGGYQHLDGLQFHPPAFTGGALGIDDAAGKPMPGGDSAIMPSCDKDPNCASYNPTSGLYIMPSANATIDTYFSKTCYGGNKASFISDTCNSSPNRPYMACPDNTFEVVLIDSYRLPPAICASTCDSNSLCNVFVTTKDQQNCELYSWYSFSGINGRLKLSAFSL